VNFDPIESLVWYIVFVISVSAHEGAHALAAYRGGDATAYLGGQVSLNPIPHMRREPFGMILVPLLTVLTRGWPIGWASTPYDPVWEQQYPRRAAWMAAAGPAANLALALLALLALRAGLDAGVFAAPDQVGFSRYVIAETQLLDNLGRFLSMALTLNSLLFLFNLLPVPPLDGASVLSLFLPPDAALRLREVMSQGPAAMIGLLVAWLLFARMGAPIFSALLALVHPGVAYS
jgi:Zn-dependent protease